MASQYAQCRQFLLDCGFRIDQNGNSFDSIGNLSAAKRMILAVRDKTAPEKHKNAEHVLWFVANCQKQTGVSFKTFCAWFETGDVPTGEFMAARDRMEAQIGDKISFAVAAAKMKKRRALSDCDGEFNPDRRDTDTPYENIVRRRMPDKTLLIDAHYAVEGKSSASDILKYAATIWSIAGIAESNGVMCEIVRHNWARRVTPCGQYESKQTIEIKKTHEYMSPALLALALHPAMYRLVGWMTRAFLLSAYDMRLKAGIGSPYQPPHVLLSSPGRLELSSRVISELPEHLEQVLVSKIVGDHNVAA